MGHHGPCHFGHGGQPSEHPPQPVESEVGLAGAARRGLRFPNDRQQLGISFQTFRSDTINPTLWQFLELLGQIIPLYLAARAALPDYVEAKGANLAAHYARVSRYFWTAIPTTLLLYLISSSVVATDGVIANIEAKWGTVAQLILIVALIIVPMRRLYVIVLPLILLTFCYDHLTVHLFG